MLAVEKKHALQDFLNLSETEIAALIAHIPFLINIKTKVVREFLQFLVHLEFSKEQILHMVNRYPELLNVERSRL